MSDDPFPISFGEAVPEEVLRDVFTTITYIPPVAPELSFQIILPQDWTQATGVEMSPLGAGTFSQVAVFSGGEEIAVQVLATLIRYEVDLVDWLGLQAEQMGLTLFNVVSGQTPYGQAVHAVGRSDNGAHLRLLTMGNGASVVLLIAGTPAHPPEVLRETLGVAAASFQFTAPCTQQTREPVAVFTDSGNLFRFLCPESWSLQPLDALRPVKAGLDCRIANENNLIAYLRIEADTRYPRDGAGLPQMVALTFQEITETGINIQEIQVVSNSEAGLPEQWLGTCQVGEGTAQVALLLRPAANCWLGVYALFPNRDSDPWGWLRGKRAYDLAVATLEPAA
jgi:hypothetical protein